MEDQSFVPTGKSEDWTDEGLKVYNNMEYFQDANTFVQVYIREDGLECSYTIPRHQWTDKIKRKAKEQGYFK